MTIEQIPDIKTAELEVSTAQPPAPAADDQKAIPPEGEETPEAQQETTEQQEARKASKFQRRLDRQKSARVAAETEARLLREERDGLKAKLEAQGRPQQESGEPKREDIDPATGQPYDFEAHLRRVAKWDAKQEALGVVKADRDAQQGSEREKQAVAGSEKIAKAWAEREQSFQATTKDYEAVVAPFIADDGELQSFSREARLAIVESDVGPALLHHLAVLADKDPAAIERLADLSPMRQVAELGKLETKVSMPAKKTTNAPAPASTTTGGRTASKDLGKMDQDEYEAHRKSQGARWAR